MTFMAPAATAQDQESLSAGWHLEIFQTGLGSALGHSVSANTIQAEGTPRSPGTADYLSVSAGAVVMGVATGGILALVGSQLGDPDAQENPAGVVGLIALGGLGYSLGSVLGANTVGKWRGLDDPGKSTLWGGVIGMVVGTAIGFAQPGDNLDGVYLPLALLAPPVGAVVGFFR
jgi:hypothetical protein